MALGVLMLGIVALSVIVTVVALLVLIAARVNPVLGAALAVLAAAGYRVATDWKPKWFLE